MTKFIQMAPSFRIGVVFSNNLSAYSNNLSGKRRKIRMKCITWDDFKTTLIESDEKYRPLFEKIEKESIQNSSKENEDYFEDSSVFGQKRKILEELDKNQDYRMIKQYLILKEENPDTVKNDYIKHFYDRVKELNKEIPDKHIDVFWQVINPFGMMERSIGKEDDSPEMFAQVFVFLCETGIFDRDVTQEENNEED